MVRLRTVAVPEVAPGVGVEVPAHAEQRCRRDDPAQRACDIVHPHDDSREGHTLLGTGEGPRGQRREDCVQASLEAQHPRSVRW
jgi:hypothetical protein